MIYLSNLTCPDLTPHFKHLVSRPMPHSFGHDVPSDWGDKADDDPVFGIYKRCGFWTHDEAALLYNVAKALGPAGWWDIGCHTGWTSAHIAAAYPIPLDHKQAHQSGARFNYVIGIDPMVGVFRDRIRENNVQGPGRCYGFEVADTSSRWIKKYGADWPPGGVCIDGDHEPGKPLEDAQNAVAHLTDTGVIIFHDFIGQPVREAVAWLLDHGFHARIYKTPHMVACCWRGDFSPPDHIPDPHVVEALIPHIAQMTDFDFTRCE